MKKNTLIKWVAGAIVMLVTATSYAQASDANTTVSPSASSAPSTKAAIRKSNRLLAKQVRHALAQVKGLDSSKIVVIARGRTITLAGSVPESDQIETAVSAAKSVKGVDTLKNSLTVKAPGQ